MRPLIRGNVAVQSHRFSIDEQLDSIPSHATEDVNRGNRRRQDAERRGRFDSVRNLHPALQCPRRLNGAITQMDSLVGRETEEGGLAGRIEGRRVNEIEERLGRKGKEGKPLQLVLNGGKHVRRRHCGGDLLVDPLLSSRFLEAMKPKKTMGASHEAS